MLVTENISFERHQEDEQWLFGIARSHFQRALHCNHLVHAKYRTKFIPVRGLRYALLIGTAAVLLLALVGAFFSRSRAQAQPVKWELGISTVGVFPLEAAGYESIEASNQGLTLQWQPKFSSGFGVRLHRNFPSSWSLETGWRRCA